MKMLNEPEIKLFGRKIYFPENGAVGERSGECSNESSGGSGDCDRCLEQSKGKDGEEVGRKEKQEQRDEEGEICETSAENEESQSTDGRSESDMKTENETTNSEQRSLKKPDKIIPCPRCKSMDTKFCYYNNYNVNQPRHFCKSCQRYWTAGGTMRNVPVGAGRRKNKNCRHIADGFHNLTFNPNATATVLSFGADSHQTDNDDSTRTPSIANQQPAPMLPWPFPWNSAVFPPMPYYLWNSGGWAVGKHPRSGEVVDSQAQKRRSSIVVPKTLRMDDPEEAARSSIWSTLGIKYDAISREGLFKALQPKKPAAASPMLQANPAALSRSLAFQERA